MRITLLMNTTSKSTRLRKFQTIYKALLRAAAVFLAEFYILWSLYQYVIKDHDEFRTQKWIGVAILAALLIYIVTAAFTDREELARIRDFLRRQCSFEQIMLILLLVWYMVSCAAWSRLDDEPYFAYNDNRLLIVTMSTFLFFPFAGLMGKHARRIMEGMVHFTMLAYTPFCAYCIYKYYRVEFFYFPSGWRLTRHSSNVSMQIGGNVNITAAASVVLFGLCLYMIMTKKRVLRILYIPAAVVHFTVTIITSSRTSFLSLLCFCVVTAFLFMRGILRNRERRTRIIGCLAAAALAGALVFAGRFLLLRMFAHVYPQDLVRMEREAREAAEQAKIKEAENRGWDFMKKKGIESIREHAAGEEAAAGKKTGAEASENAAKDTTASVPASTSPSPARRGTSDAEKTALTAGSSSARVKPEPRSVVRAEDEVDENGARKMNSLSGRIEVWKAAVRLIFSTHFKIRFGVTPAAIDRWLAKTLTNGAKPPHAHNIVLQVGCGTGVPGMLAFVLFLIGLIRRCLVLVFKKAEKLPAYFWIIPAIIMAILVIEMAEAMTFAMVRLNLAALYMLAGCCAWMDRAIMDGERTT